MMNRFIQNEKGNVLVLVALMMVFLLGIAALVTDGGRVYLEKSSLQKALDAAVLGGGQVVMKSEAHAVTVAKDISLKTRIHLKERQFQQRVTLLKLQKK